jgi:hypothetical protein
MLCEAPQRDDTGGNTRNSQQSTGNARTEDADIRPDYAIVLFVPVKQLSVDLDSKLPIDDKAHQ